MFILITAAVLSHLCFDMVIDNPDKQLYSDRACRRLCKDGSGSGLGQSGLWPILRSYKQVYTSIMYFCFTLLWEGYRFLHAQWLIASELGKSIFHPWIAAESPFSCRDLRLKAFLAEGFSGGRQRPFQNNRAVKQWKVKGLAKGIKVQ